MLATSHEISPEPNPLHEFLIKTGDFAGRIEGWRGQFESAAPFRHVVIDDFLRAAHASFLHDRFPGIDHPVWLDWRKRSGHQYGKQGPGDSARFETLEPEFWLALNEFNSWKFVALLEQVTGIRKLIPDPYFSGGGMHQILRGGILDIHTDFNLYERLDLRRRLNVLIYLNQDWQPGYAGCLELWDGPPGRGQCARSIAPLFNRAVIFHTNKESFHGHPAPWNAPEPLTRKSIALYYYTASEAAGARYDAKTDFQSVAFRAVPGSGNP